MEITTSLDQVQVGHEVGAQILPLLEKAYTAERSTERAGKTQQTAIEAAYLILRPLDVNTIKSARYFVAAEFPEGKLDNKGTKLFAVLTGNIVQSEILKPTDYDEFYGKDGLLKAYNLATMSDLEKDKAKYLKVLDKREDAFQEHFWSVHMPKHLGIVAALDASAQVEEVAEV